MCTPLLAGEDARRLVTMLNGISCKVNLIIFNPHIGTWFSPSTMEKALSFRCACRYSLQPFIFPLCFIYRACAFFCLLAHSSAFCFLLSEPSVAGLFLLLQVYSHSSWHGGMQTSNNCYCFCRHLCVH